MNSMQYALQMECLLSKASWHSHNIGRSHFPWFGCKRGN